MNGIIFLRQTLVVRSEVWLLMRMCKCEAAAGTAINTAFFGESIEGRRINKHLNVEDPTHI
jgi:hypothetical protein